MHSSPGAAPFPLLMAGERGLRVHVRLLLVREGATVDADLPDVVARPQAGAAPAPHPARGRRAGENFTGLLLSWVALYPALLLPVLNSMPLPLLILAYTRL